LLRYLDDVTYWFMQTFSEKGRVVLMDKVESWSVYINHIM